MALYQGEVKVAGGTAPVGGLTADVIDYVNGSTGLDSNDGLTVGAALRTINVALGKIPKNLNGFTATINVAAVAHTHFIAKDFIGSLIIIGSSSGAIGDTASYEVASGYIERCSDISLTGLDFTGSSGTGPSSLEILDSNCVMDYCTFTNDLAGVGASGVQVSRSYLHMKTNVINMRSVGILAGPDGAWGGMLLVNAGTTFVGCSAKAWVLNGSIYKGVVSDVTSLSGIVLDANGISSDLMTKFDTLLTAATETATMSSTDILPVTTTGFSATRKITWANFVLAIRSGIANATQSVAGWMSELDKVKLDGYLKNQSVAPQGPGFATETYIAGSRIVFPFAPRVGTTYKCLFHVAKTNVGTGAIIIRTKIGTLGTTADLSITAHTFGAGSAVADDGLFEMIVTFRTVGSGTSAILVASVKLNNALASTGLTGIRKAVLSLSGGFDSTAVGAGIGISYTGGTSAAHTISLVSAELIM